MRWAESAKRKNRGIYETINDSIKDRKILMSDNDDARQLLETCFKTKTIAVNPIIDWSDDDVWEYIKLRNLPYNPLYDTGRKRVGCIGCPMNTKQAQELAEMPMYAKAYKRAFAKFLDTHPMVGKDLRSANDWYNWWLSGKAAVAPGNLTMFDEEEEDEIL